jgi:hypothetical protein
MASTAAVMTKGIDILLRNLGVLDTELFITTILKEPADYTEWARAFFARYDNTPDIFLREAVEYDAQNPVVMAKDAP